MNRMTIIITLSIIISLTTFLFIVLIVNRTKYRYKKKKLTEKKAEEIKKILMPIMDGKIPISIIQFEKTRRLLFGSNIKFKGIYILYNETKDTYLIGDSTDIFNRINRHLKGEGNGNFYSDYKYGDTINIRMKYLTDNKYMNIKNEIKKMEEKLEIKNKY